MKTDRDTRLGERILAVWEEQKRYQGLVTSKGSRSYDEWMQTYLLGMVSKVDEVLEALRWKVHRSGELPSSANLSEALADMTKYLLCLWQESGHDLEGCLGAVERKSEVLRYLWEQENRRIPQNSRVIVCDIDGTLGDFRSGFLSYVGYLGQKGQTSLEVVQPVRSPNLSLVVEQGWPPEEYERVKALFEADGGYFDLVDPYPAVIGWLKDRIAEDWQVEAWTARPYNKYKRVWLDSRYWLEAQNLRIESLEIGHTDRLDRVSQMLRYGNQVMLIDDNPDILQRAAGIPGLESVRVLQPYNSHLPGDLFLLTLDPEDRGAL